MSKIDIDKLFRANQHKLTERPSSETWQKLEHRLDRHRGRRRMRRQNHYAMAAALLFLIVMIGVISLYTNGKIKRQSASIQLEEFSNDFDSKEALKVIEFTRHHQERLAKPIKEVGENEELLIIKK